MQSKVLIGKKLIGWYADLGKKVFNATFKLTNLVNLGKRYVGSPFS